MRPPITATLALLATLALAGPRCAAPVEDLARGETRLERLSLRSVRWRLAWDREGVTPLPRGWRVTSSEGVEVEVLDGGFVVAGLTLTRCEPSSALRWWGSPIAHAHHSKVLDVSAWPTMFAADLGGLEDLTLGPRGFDAADYCGAHWAVGAAPEGRREEIPEAWGNTALRVSGRWRREGRSGEFTITTRLGNGAALGMVAARPLDLGARSVTVTLRPRVARLFDRVDLERGEPVANAWAMLESLVHSARFEVEADPGG